MYFGLATVGSGFGFRISGSEFRVSDFGFAPGRSERKGSDLDGLSSKDASPSSPKFRVSVFRFRFSVFGFRVFEFRFSVFGIRDSGIIFPLHPVRPMPSRFRDSGFGIWDSKFGLQVLESGFRVSGFEFRG